jgi:hypothetical protein
MFQKLLMFLEGNYQNGNNLRHKCKPNKLLLLKQVIKAVKKLITREGYDIIYSIGEDCACAAWLQSYNLRLTSGPFDWLCKAKLDVRFLYLINRFQGFLNSPNDLQREFDPRYDNDERYPHFIYNNVKDGFAFLHDFEKNTTKNFEESFDMVKKGFKKGLTGFIKIYQAMKKFY